MSASRPPPFNCGAKNHLCRPPPPSPEPASLVAGGGPPSASPPPHAWHRLEFAGGSDGLWSADAAVAPRYEAVAEQACATGATVVFWWAEEWHDLVRLPSVRLQRFRAVCDFNASETLVYEPAPFGGTALPKAWSPACTLSTRGETHPRIVVLCYPIPTSYTTCVIFFSYCTALV